jgi:hypothetical protein
MRAALRTALVAARHPAAIPQPHPSLLARRISSILNMEGHHVHRLDQLRQSKLRGRAKLLPSSAEFDGNAAAVAFKLFGHGFGPADAVVRACLASRVARDLYRDWADLRNMFVVNNEARQRIEQLAFSFNYGDEINNSEDLIRALDLACTESCRWSRSPGVSPACASDLAVHVRPQEGVASEYDGHLHGSSASRCLAIRSRARLLR